MTNEWAKGVLSDVENLTEERVDEVLREYLNDFKLGSLETKGWPVSVSAYVVSKVAINAYTRILAKKFPNLNWLCQNRYELQQRQINHRRRCRKSCVVSSAAQWRSFRSILFAERRDLF